MSLSHRIHNLRHQIAEHDKQFQPIPEPRVSTHQDAVYGDAEIRGRLRIWKQELAVTYNSIQSHRRDNAARDIMREFILRRTDKGRHRAYKRLINYIGPGLTPVYRGYNPPLLIFCLLHPQPSVFKDPPPDTAMAQPCVTVDYASLDHYGWAGGLWTLVLPDHALGRAMHRSGLHPEQLVAEAHSNVLKLRVDAVVPTGQFDSKRKFWVRAGPGAFYCRLDLVPGLIHTHYEERVLVFAHTWYNDLTMNRHHIVLTPDGEPGEQLGDLWLKPLSLRRKDVKKIPMVRGGLPTPTDMRHDFTPSEVGEWVAYLRTMDVVTCHHDGDENSYEIVKGEELIDPQTGVISANTVARLAVANTSQIEIFRTITDDPELAMQSLDALALMLTVAAGLPGGMHDDTLFDAAMAKLDPNFTVNRMRK